MKLGICYYPEHWPEELWANDAAEMAELGISLVRIGEFAWSRIEPRQGEFHWDWLDRAMDTLHAAGHNIILGTPSATPPRWVLDLFPDMVAVDKKGQKRGFGSRRHYCFSHGGYRELAAEMAERMAARYSMHPALHSWQIDNEYGCHDTTLSYSENARTAFHQWLSHKYRNIEALNTAWGNVFWSMEYGDFDDIALPNLTVTEANPAHWLDFYRFSSEQVAHFNRSQVEAIRRHSDKPLIHNYMGRITDFDHFDVGANLEIASWDSYPLGFLEDRSDHSDEFRHEYQRQGDPDFQAFHHDLYRSVGRGRWGVMEQQPGPVNWAPYNPAPLPGMVRAWSWEAIAHGAEFVSYFRWRQAPFAQEQMHAGLKRPDNTPAPVCAEIAQLSTELQNLTLPKSEKAKVALIFDYESAWAWTIQPQGADFDYFRLALHFYSALRELGLDIDILPPSHRDFDGYKLILAPGLFTLPTELLRSVEKCNGHVVFGPRTAHKTPDFQINIEGLKTKQGLDIKIIQVESLRPSERIALNSTGNINIWQEHIEIQTKIFLKTKDGAPVLCQSGQHYYLAAWPDELGLLHIFESLLKVAEVPIEPLPDGVRARSRGDWRIYVNYAAEPREVRGHELLPAGVLIIDQKTGTTILPA